MTCRELVELVTDYFEGALPEDTRAAFEEHISLCEGCAFYLDQVRTTIRLANDTQALEESPAVNALLEEFRDWKAHQ